MKKLAVFFPGIGYTPDKPLLYYSRDLMAELGFEEIVLRYGNFPKKKPGDGADAALSYQTALSQSEEQLAETDFGAYDDIVFIAKSIGTAAAAEIASKSPYREKIRLILYTPLAETFSVPFGKAVVFTGTNDPWVGKQDSPIPRLSAERKIPCHVIEGGNHSLETDDVHGNLKILQEVIRAAEEFVREFGPDR